MNIKFILQTKKSYVKKKRMLRNLKIVTKIEIIVDKSKSRLDNNEEKKVSRETKIKKKKSPNLMLKNTENRKKKDTAKKKKKKDISRGPK